MVNLTQSIRHKFLNTFFHGIQSGSCASLLPSALVGFASLMHLIIFIILFLILF